jgi:Protein of unknown function (DUF1573)
VVLFKTIEMKKTILLFTLSAALLNVNAQTTPVVDPHAGHNHAKEAVKETVKEVKQKVAVAAANVQPKQATNVAPTGINAGMITPGNTMPAMNTAVPTTPVVPVVPESLVAKELEFDFGKIPQGKPVTHVFTVTNTSKTAYKLDNVQASCGCTTPEWDREKVIEPGASTDIKVGFNAGAVAPFSKPVTITYNGSQTKVLTIKGEVYTTPATSAPANTEVNEIKK